MASQHMDNSTSTPKDMESDAFTQIGEACFSYLVTHPDALSHFMQTTGMSPDQLRQSLGTEGLTDGMLDYFVAHEPSLLALCANKRLSPEAVSRLWHKRNPGHA